MNVLIPGSEGTDGSGGTMTVDGLETGTTITLESAMDGREDGLFAWSDILGTTWSNGEVVSATEGMTTCIGLGDWATEGEDSEIWS
jgi:hypothetical protein